jgi:hypothetical protein
MALGGPALYQAFTMFLHLRDNSIVQLTYKY